MNLIIERTFIFLTFFGSCIVIGFILSAAVKDSWISADATYIPNILSTPNSKNSKHVEDSKKSKWGTVKLGIFNYEKILNSGYGVRQNKTRITDIFDKEKGFLDFNTYLFTCCGLSISLISSCAAAISSVFGTLRERGEITLIAIFNGLAFLGHSSAIIGWIYQRMSFLENNMILTIDQRNWTSKGLSKMDLSFYFLIIACIITIINLILLIVVKYLKMKRRTPKALDEKDGNSIMLY